MFNNTLINYINDAIKEVSDELGEDVKKEVELSIKKDFDVDSKFELNISKLFDEVSSYYDKAVPFENLLNVLEFNNDTSSDIMSVMSSIEIIISGISNDKRKEEIES